MALSADGNTAIIGGYLDNGGTGAAWVFTRTAGVWSQQGSKLVGTGAIGSAWQGLSVGLSADGNTVIVGGPADNGGKGAVWVFKRAGGVWSQYGDKLVGIGGDAYSWMGNCLDVSADGSTFIVGAEDDNHQTGAAWIFTTANTTFHVISITDIPVDQGKQVRIKWQKSPFDASGAIPQIVSYSIWRKSSSGANSTVRRALRPVDLTMDSTLLYYDYVTSIPAMQLPQYQAVVPTLEDSTASGIHRFTFRVAAHTADVNEYFVSSPDSGYSVDNLAPIPPAGLLASVQAGPQVKLTWNPPADSDVESYSIYRSPTSGFAPAPGNNIGTSHSTTFTDVSPLSGDLAYYRIIAVDVHDNQSLPSAQVSAAITVTQQSSLQNNWNIVSVPLTVSDFTKTALYPTALSPAFAYNGAYVITSTLAPGAGYWLKFSGAQSTNMTGLLLTNDTISVREGWNVVGSLSQPIAVSSISSIPGGIVTSHFFGYQGGYSHRDSIRPGQGYWVKVSQAGQLVLAGAGEPPSSNRIRIDDRGENPPPPPEVVASAVPETYSLEQNYPNPFNPATTIRYSLPVSEHVKLSVYNMLGQEVATLVNEVQDAGYETVSFDASGLSSGIYMYRITAGTFTDVKKLLLVR